MNREGLRLRLELYLKYIGVLFLLAAGCVFMSFITNRLLDWFLKYFFDHRIETGLVVATIGVVLIATSYLIKRMSTRRAT